MQKSEPPLFYLLSHFTRYISSSFLAPHWLNSFIISHGICQGSTKIEITTQKTQTRLNMLFIPTQLTRAEFTTFLKVLNSAKQWRHMANSPWTRIYEHSESQFVCFSSSSSALYKCASRDDKTNIVFDAMHHLVSNSCIKPKNNSSLYRNYATLELFYYLLPFLTGLIHPLIF